jgi:hypothetical protein
MPRFFVERDFGKVGEDVLQDFAARATATGAKFFRSTGSTRCWTRADKEADRAEVSG